MLLSFSCFTFHSSEFGQPAPSSLILFDCISHTMAILGYQVINSSIFGIILIFGFFLLNFLKMFLSIASLISALPPWHNQHHKSLFPICKFSVKLKVLLELLTISNVIYYLLCHDYHISASATVNMHSIKLFLANSDVELLMHLLIA